MIAFAIIGSTFCLLLGIDKICDRLKEIRHDTNTHLDRIACIIKCIHDQNLYTDRSDDGE